ncbi:uncharacterized protein LOC122756548 [Drosophila santomea]|uniref:uncharacterized protein LOC122756548 n=1 Tax=Drosophila santomea TaxID=129105 RepID=UPI001CCE5A10|nr:uncharacterized protein LOC122756548 [Drosophila santomea]
MDPANPYIKRAAGLWELSQWSAAIGWKSSTNSDQPALQQDLPVVNIINQDRSNTNNNSSRRLSGPITRGSRLQPEDPDARSSTHGYRLQFRQKLEFQRPRKSYALRETIVPQHVA